MKLVILKKAINTDANVFFYGNISPNGGKAKVPTVKKKPRSSTPFLGAFSLQTQTKLQEALK